MSNLQALDLAGNSLPFAVTINIELVNDNSPVLVLDGAEGTVDYFTIFDEGQDYLGGPQPVRLSNNLTIFDDDVGPQYLNEAIIFINESGKLLLYYITDHCSVDWVCVAF